jgi:protease-4
VDPQLGHRREYKTARNLFTERAFTEPHRESLQAIVDDAAGQIVDGIAAGRGLDAAVVRAAMDRGPFTAKEALEARLVDRLSYRDEVYGALRTGERARFLHLERYLRRAGRPYRKGALVALVHAVGAIHRGTAGPSSASIGSDDVTAALRRAARSKRVKAILFRVDSGGGSAVASEAIWREVARARERKKPVVVSMGNVAGSGGYYVACGADRIVASPATLTGSIGVVWGKFVTREAWRKVGVTWDALKVGEHADLWSPAHDLGDAGWAKLEGHLDTIYEDFKAKVAAGRGMSPEQVEEVAKGRVWTGARAKDLRLIDGLGGLRTALDVVREVAGLPAGSPLRIRTFHPRRRRFPFGAGGEEGSEEALRAVRGALAGVDPAFALAFDALGAPRGPLVVPPLDLSTAAPPRV